MGLFAAEDFGDARHVELGGAVVVVDAVLLLLDVGELGVAVAGQHLAVDGRNLDFGAERREAARDERPGEEVAVVDDADAGERMLKKRQAEMKSRSDGDDDPAVPGGGSTVTTGVRGLSEEELKNAQPNPAAVAALEQYAVAPDDARRFAQKGALTAAPGIREAP
mgnify:CR=1 FL=1